MSGFEFVKKHNEGFVKEAGVVQKTRNSSTWRFILADKRAIFAISVLVILSVASLLAFLTPYDQNALSIQDKLLPPSGSHWFGTDDHGRDYFTRVLYGGRISIAVGVLSMIIAIVVGTLAGTISGYFGGVIDNLMMRFLDIFMSIPSFFLLMILNAYLKPGIGNIIVIIGLLSWMDVARIVRAETLTLKGREFVMYAQSSGAGFMRIILKHIIPNAIPSIVVAASLNVAGAILTESALSFLGLGVQQPNASWGSMLNNAQGYMGDATYLAIFPGLLILLTILSFNILGDVFRKAMAR
ncbi:MULTISPECIES: ABC transporter permease [Brochothrix]|uniref:ABC transporter permease n=1 Tax=Brochothrix thermosphacta TaxID=2756 RepID=A0A1D2K5K8_BROTH|nr:MULTISPECIES: ABC transporter permease [Brochothrix]ANZ94264.1 peptide ABC transporter permease [Brochothrix thermosphacta]ANZ97442.1 peptide ABC transporter permease [Brochothrix thermosphacta]ATF26883.1 ABC transporter permease [Brochothrix thermosphacta]ATH86240.1 ABC transporter permease [Brochothrix thermosphacta]EUJ35080.1 oligopeptide ABC transporter permease [Brochothrix thermosphacta DSM 20171 = FSL F6-1036]